jgi:hypothetical protein
MIGTFAIVGAANRSGSLLQAAFGLFLLTAAAGVGFWIIHKVAKTSGI